MSADYKDKVIGAMVRAQFNLVKYNFGGNARKKFHASAELVELDVLAPRKKKKPRSTKHKIHDLATVMAKKRKAA